MRCSLALPIGLGVLLTSCSATPTGVVTRQDARQTMLSAAASTNGRGGVMPAYYDAQLFTINFKEEPGGAEQALLAHNGSINTIYMCDACEAAGFMFTSVLDAIQGDGFNPLWRERSEEHTSELQSLAYLVCRLLLEKKKTKHN